MRALLTTCTADKDPRAAPLAAGARYRGPRIDYARAESGRRALPLFFLSELLFLRQKQGQNQCKIQRQFLRKFYISLGDLEIIKRIPHYPWFLDHQRIFEYLINDFSKIICLAWPEQVLCRTGMHNWHNSDRLLFFY